MSLLSANDRAYILNQLTLAPDSVLTDAMLAFDAIRNKIATVRKLVSPSPEETPAPAAEAAPQGKPTRRNINPGVSAITRIGGPTRVQVLGYLDSGMQPPAKFEEHCKLLWERGEVKFDGQEYYL